MKQIATALLFDADGKFLIYLRDGKPTIPFPNHWDLFGGHVEDNESPEIALLRELREELNITPLSYKFIKSYVVTSGDVLTNTKHVFEVQIAEKASSLTLYEGKELRAINLFDWPQYRWANVLAMIIEDYVKSLQK